MKIRLFIYGTLKPGHERWPALQPYIDKKPKPAKINGIMYHLGLYPALIKSSQPEKLAYPIKGYSVLIDTTKHPNAFSHLDTIEGHPHLFKRQMAYFNELNPSAIEGEPCHAQFVKGHVYTFASPKALETGQTIKSWHPEFDDLENWDKKVEVEKE